jgi:hypothetical protein
MDHSNGTQSSSSLLPSVETLEPGLVLLFKHPNVDRRYILQHISDLNDSPALSSLGPGFDEKDLSTGPLDEVLASLTKTRARALEAKRVYFILTPAFPPRMRALGEIADSVFHYSSGINCALITATKIEGLTFQVPSVEHMGMIVRRPERNKRETHDMSEGITITVSGKINSGLSAVSAVIMNALQDKWPHIKIDWQDPDGEHHQNIVRSNLVEGCYDTIDAKSFLIQNDTTVKNSTVNA